MSEKIFRFGILTVWLVLNMIMFGVLATDCEFGNPTNEEYTALIKIWNDWTKPPQNGNNQSPIKLTADINDQAKNLCSPPDEFKPAADKTPGYLASGSFGNTFYKFERNGQTFAINRFARSPFFTRLQWEATRILNCGHGELLTMINGAFNNMNLAQMEANQNMPTSIYDLARKFAAKVRDPIRNVQLMIFGEITCSPTNLEKLAQSMMESVENFEKLGKYSDDFEDFSNRSFLHFEKCYYSSVFSLYMIMGPASNTFFDIRESCSKYLNNSFENRALFSLRILYKVYIMQQMGYAHCNINLKSFRYSDDFTNFYLTDFGTAISVGSNGKTRCTRNPGYEPPEEFFETEENNPPFSFERISPAFEFDAFAAGKVMLEMGIDGDGYKQIKEKYEKFLEAEAIKGEQLAKPIPTYVPMEDQDARNAREEKIRKQQSDLQETQKKVKTNFYEKKTMYWRPQGIKTVICFLD